MGTLIQVALVPRLAVLSITGIVVATVLLLYHSWAARMGGRPSAWPLTLALQAVLAYASAFPFAGYPGTVGPFLAGSVLLLLRGRWRWAGYAAVVISYPLIAVYTGAWPLSEYHGEKVPAVVYIAGNTAAIGLLVFGLSWLVGTARQLEDLRGELARMAVVTERLRVARDVHDLVGLGLSAVALKADLAGKLIGRDDGRAAAEIEEISRICATAQADISMVNRGSQQLSLVAELAAAGQILSSAGIRVRTSMPEERLPTVADLVLVPVLREAVTNILRHSAAASATIELTAGNDTLRLAVSNDGAARQNAVDDDPGMRSAGAGSGNGLANLTARVHEVGGQLASRLDGGRFELTAEIPLSASSSVGAITGPGAGSAVDLAPGRPVGSR